MNFPNLWPPFRRDIRTHLPEWQTAHPDVLRQSSEYARVTAGTDSRPAVDRAKLQCYAAIERDALFQTAASVHELGCGWGDNLIALARMFPRLDLSGSDFNEDQIRRLRHLPEFTNIALDVIDLEAHTRTLRPVDVLLLWGVEFALTDAALMNLATTCREQTITRNIYVFSNHLAGLRTAVGAVKDLALGHRGARLIGSYRSARLLEHLLQPYRLVRVRCGYGGSTFSLLHLTL